MHVAIRQLLMYNNLNIWCRGDHAATVHPGMAATQGNGVKIPAFNQYRRHRELCPSAKAGHWGIPREGRAQLRLRCESGDLL